MLQEMHEKVHGFIAWFIIIVIAITFALFGASYYIGTHGASDVKATVGSKSITKREFHDVYERHKQNQRIVSIAQEQQLKASTLQQLISNYSLVDGANREGFLVSNGQAQQAMMSIPQFLEEGQFSQARFSQILSANLFTPQSFLAQVQQGMLLNQQRFMLTASNFALKSDIDDFIRLTKQRRSYRYLTVTDKSFDKPVTVNQKEAKEYYDKHQQKFMTPETVQLSYVELAMPAILKSIHFTSEELHSYYNDNQTSFVIPAEYQVQHILVGLEDQEKLKKAQAALKSGQPFAKVATRYSEDLLASDGKLPWLGAGVMDKAVDSVLITMKKGQVSEPIKTEKGYEIIKLLDKKPVKQQPFAAVKERIVNMLRADRAQQLFSDSSDKLTDLSYQNPDSLDTVAKALSLSIKETKPFTRKAKDKSGLLSHKLVIDTAFSHELLELGENSQPLPIGEDSVIVVRVKKRVKPSLRPFTQVMAEIKAQLTKQKSSTRAKQFGEELLASMKANKSVDATLKAHHLAWVSVIDAEDHMPKLNAEVNAMAFEMSLAKGKKAAFSGSPLSDGFVLIALSAIKSGDLKSVVGEERDMLKKQLETSYGLRDYDIYSRQLLKETPVSIKEA